MKENVPIIIAFTSFGKFRGMISIRRKDSFLINIFIKNTRGFPRVPVVKNLTANARDIKDPGSIPGLGRSPEEEHSNPFQYSCLENPMDGGAWQLFRPQGHKEPDKTEAS